MEKYWMRGCPVRTHYYNALSILFPAWEGLFVEVVRARLPQVHDADLKARMVKFMAQETAHKNAHHSHNVRNNLIVQELEEYERTKVAGMRPKMKVWLAAMVSIEHIAANLSRDFLIRYPNDPGKEAALFRWHSVEELEHKSLAVDLWDYLGYSRKDLRSLVGANLRYVVRSCHRHVIAQLREDGLLSSPTTWGKLALWYVYLVKTLVVPYFRIYGTTFHPSDIDDSRLILGHT